MQATEATSDAARSAQILKAAKSLLPRAAGSEPASGRPTAGDALLFVKGKGAVVTDADGRHFLDFAGAGGSSILGHADETVVVAINKAASKGCFQPAISEAQIRLAELIASRVEAIDQIRFYPALDLAACDAVATVRRATGRRRIIRFDGCRHGHAPFQAGDADDSASGSTDADRVLPFNDAEKLQEVFDDQGDDMAAVLLQPFAHSFGLVLPTAEFLSVIQANCDKHGAMLILDERLSGFRVAAGGAAQLLNITPNLTLLAGVIGGGLPLAALGGKKDLLANNPTSSDSSSARLPVSSLAVSAGVAALQSIAEDGCHQALEELSARLEEGVRAAAASAGVAICINRVASLLGLYFADAPVVDFASARRANIDAHRSFHNAMLDRGVLLPASPFAPIVLNTAHTQEQVDSAVEAAHESFHDLDIAK